MINDNNKLNELFAKIKISFVEACEIGDLETIKLYKETGALLTTSFSVGFGKACCNSNMELIKYLLKEIPDKLLKDMQQEKNNHLETITKPDVVKFLLASDEVKYKSDIHRDNDKYFYFLCNSYKEPYSKKFATEILSYLIFDYDIMETAKMKEVIADFPEIQKMFALRDLNKKLNVELDTTIKMPRVKL